mgnify:CR=1 FL=1
MLDLNEKFVQYSILKREVDANRLLYDTLQTNIKKENITEQTQTVNIWVIDKAELANYAKSGNIDIAQDVVNRCPARCMAWDGKNLGINNRDLSTFSSGDGP